MNPVDVTLYLVTDRKGLDEKTFLQRIEDACKGGVTLVQLREKDCGGREMLELACKVKAITDRYCVPLVINDRVDVAIACGCAGVHVGQSDLPAEIVRRMLGPDKIIGVTAKTPALAREAFEQGADYLGCGAMFSTSTKEEAKVITPAQLDEVCIATPLPVVAIGGLNYDTVEVLKGTRCDGAAVVRGLMQAQDAVKAAQNLKARLQALLLPAEQRKL